MEKMCFSSSVYDGRENQIDNSVDNAITTYTSENFSPRNDTITNSNKTKFVPDVDNDIPSYQIARGSKRFSDMSEEQESILLISPVSTPPSIKKIENFQVPLIPTIGTVVKKNASVKVILSGNADNYPAKESTKKYESAFEVLGMVDNDISWSSSMETPAHNPICLDEYNTLEKATLLPEKDIKNVQPRVLFSPCDNGDSECMPLKYSSGSEDEKDSYSTKLDASGSCESYIKAKTSDLMKRTTGTENNFMYEKSPNKNLTGPSHIEDTGFCPISPVFRISKKNSKSKKQKPLLIKSPDTTDKNNVAISDYKNLDEMVQIKIGNRDPLNEAPATEKEKIPQSHHESIKVHANITQDDSFQDISITCLNELCNTSIFSDDCNLTDNVDLSPVMKEENDIGNSEKHGYIKKNVSPTEVQEVSGKCFYDTCKTDELHPVISINGFLKSAKQLEECNAALENKPCLTFSDSDIEVFNKMVIDLEENGLTGHAVKRARPVFTEKSADPCQKKIKLGHVNEPEALQETKEEKQIDEEHLGYYENLIKAITSQCNVNPNLKGVASVYGEQAIDNNKIVIGGRNPIFSLNKTSNTDGMLKKKFESNENNVPETNAMFSTASGKPIPVASESRIKALKVLNDEYEENRMTTLHKKEDNIPPKNFQGFQTASGSTVKISEDSLNKAKKLLMELNADNNCSGSDDYCAPVGFTTASGMKVKISEESLKKAKRVLCDTDATDLQKNTRDFEEFIEEGSVGIASNELSKTPQGTLRKTSKPCGGIEVIPTNNRFIALRKSELNKNGSGKNHVVSEASDGTYISVKPKSGFKTASGKNITFSEKALLKVRQMLSEETMDPGTGEIIIENTESTNAVCPEESTDTGVIENKRVPIRDNEQRYLEDSSELIPPWLHAYRTSPALTMEPMNIGRLISVEDCSNYFTPTERYFVKSPVLGATDRFFNLKKNRKPGKKLFFNSPKKYLEDEVQNSDHSARKNNPSIKRDLSELDNNFSISFKKRKINEDVGDTANNDVGKLSSEVIRERKEARLRQKKAGKKMNVNPMRGSHISKKKQRQMTWNEALKGDFPEIYSDETLQKYGVKNNILQVTAANALDYKFKAEDFYTTLSCLSNVNGFLVGDDCLLIFDDDNMAGVEEFTWAFFASSGVEPNLISPEWIRNHYKWIVWKLSHYERSFPHVFGGNCLTPHNVMVQLKYRYDREIDNCERSALKKILERDECSAKRMVLCVFNIKASDSDLGNKTTESQFNRSIVPYELGLTDGWYSCYVQIDSAMSQLIEKGKVTIGTKLVTQGAELLNCNDGVSPLEAAEKVHLKIFTNSTRRVKWDTKLGFQKYGGPILVSLNSILPNGGLIGRLDVVITRIYPILYMEKKSDGTHVIRNRRTEDKAASAHQEEQEVVYEKIYQEVKNEVQNKAKEKKLMKKVSMSNISKLSDPEELLKLYEDCSDPSTFQNLLTPEQKQVLIDYQQRKKELANKELSDLVQEKIKAGKMSTRKVSQLLRVKIVDLHKADYANAVLFTIWNSTEDVSQILSEGKAISIFNTLPNNSRLHKPVQLNSTRYTQYREISKLVEYPARKLTHFRQLVTLDYEPVFNEIDVVGIVVFIREISYGSKLSQTVYLADSDFNFIGLVFWGSCKNLGWESILTVGSIVACSNLQWSNKRKADGIPSVYVNDSSVFKENPKEDFLREGMTILRTSLPEDLKKYIGKCEDEIIATLDDSKHSNVSRNSSHPYDMSKSLLASGKPKYINGFKMKPNAWSTPCKSDAFGLDTSDQEPSPIQKRIEKLQLYGEPPPLSPLLPVENLEKFNTKFKAPSRSAADSSTK